ncbi:YicC/YloC family endoribonuclease [Roseobacter sp. AzwK-3b]|uniref:YicC/YloC family endoribonuclease n=1 Tax=Roseobacter sp. AzwK-3b TaxID=351016 RepID=UPI0002DC6BD2|nr:YicC/YloC family endoribonuclease [Roseobacter sp. AzwK-3b]
MLNSMTAFASGKGAFGPQSWTWELRSVNGKGLDLRLRLPDWIEGLEPALRARLSSCLARGNISLGLRVQSEDRAGRLAVNEAALDDILAAMARVEARAQETGVTLAPSTPADLVAMRGVLDSATTETETGPLRDAILADFEAPLADFLAMRAAEGAALSTILSDQLDQIASLTEQAGQAAETRRADMAGILRTQLARIMDNADGADAGRIAQELALIAVKSDVTEEIDRLRAHVAAARALLAESAPIGRKLDFLSQEFNREANTLCSKAQNTALTAIGLDLKAVIDQMREQVQNVE